MAHFSETRVPEMQFPISSGCRLQRDIFVIGLNDTFKHFRSDLISWENLTTLTFAQVIIWLVTEASLKSESAMTRQQLEESVHQVTPGEDTAYKVTPDAIKSKTPRAFLQTASSCVAVHYMQLVMIVLQPMTPVTTVAKGSLATSLPSIHC